MLYHCRMWCYAIGVEAVVLRSWCVILCTVCQLVSSLLIYMMHGHNYIKLVRGVKWSTCYYMSYKNINQITGILCRRLGAGCESH